MQPQAKEWQGLPATRSRESGKEGSSPRAVRGNKPADTLILHFRPPELGKNKFLLSKATQLVVICYSSPRTLRRYPWASEVGG